MKSLSLAGLAGLATLAAQAQTAPLAKFFPAEPVLVTATRSLVPGVTLRDATVIPREEIEAAGPVSLAELLQRRAGVEFRATGGPGQPAGLLVRGAGTAQTLVLVDGLRVGSATVGTTSIENIPLELIERIEVVKGPLSSLYGSEAIGGVVQVFTRGKAVPHLFASAALGSDRDRRASAGLATVDGDLAFSVSGGARRVDAPSATTERAAFCHDPDRDPHESAFGNVRAAWRRWTGETLALEAFGSRGRTEFDGCSKGTKDRNDQTLSGVRLTSSTSFTRDWAARLTAGQGRDRLDIRGDAPGRLETRQDQLSFVNEVALAGGSAVAGVEWLRQRVSGDTRFAQTRRETRSAFGGITQAWAGNRLEASVRRDDDDAFDSRSTGSVSYGWEWTGWGRLAATAGRGFRAPTFFDLFGPASDFYQPNPQLRPERSLMREVSFRSDPARAWRWSVSAFDNRVEDLIVYVLPRMENVDRARIRGVEASVQGTAWGTQLRASFTAQRPRDDVTGLRLPARAERFGSLEVSRRFGPWTAGVSAVASGERYDAPGEPAAGRLGGYAVVDARLRYAAAKHWSFELAATNLADKRYETALGFEGTRRGVLASVRFEAF